jgi:AcrR family transcriptional regulator
MVDSGARSERVYGGRSAEDRRRERHERFVAAGLEIIGTDGYSAVSVRSLCRAAGLAERYYYESFTSREDVLAAVYEQVITDLTVAAYAAVDPDLTDVEELTRRSLEAFIGLVTTDRRRARIQLIEVVGVSDALERRRRDVMHSFALLVANSARDHGLGAGIDVDTVSLGLVGAVNELLIDWYHGRLGVDLATLTDTCTTLFLRAFAVPHAAP